MNLKISLTPADLKVMCRVKLVTRVVFNQIQHLTIHTDRPGNVMAYTIDQFVSFSSQIYRLFEGCRRTGVCRNRNLFLLERRI